MEVNKCAKNVHNRRRYYLEYSTYMMFPVSSNGVLACQIPTSANLDPCQFRIEYAIPVRRSPCFSRCARSWQPAAGAKGVLRAAVL